ncbi:cell wall-active antibiotics response protein LiaF [Ectobacillus polymachus]|uniref:cell wall-active antibiotics response protein LiaF n=1 Tax=Ectobacillus polymachus TaxID=1508806 RepID=UPI003A88DA6F
MKKIYTKTQVLAVFMIIFAIGMFIDIIFHRFQPFGLFFSAILLILGRHFRKKGKRARGNIFLVISVFFFIGTIFSSTAFQMLLVSILVFIGYRLYTSSDRPSSIKVALKEDMPNERIVRHEPFLKNMLNGNYRIINETYELQDINIRYGLGDVVIDLTNAMIPEGETVIIIHGLVGNITLFVPYDLELSVHHSVMVGNIVVLGEEEKGWNQNVILRTEGYGLATRRIKIMTSLLVGDTEVRYS